MKARYVVREVRMYHKDHKNHSEVKYWGIFTEEEAKEFAESIKGRLVEICEVNAPA